MITVDDIKSIDMNTTALDRHLEILKDEGLLEREGTKGGKWVIHYKNMDVGE